MQTYARIDASKVAELFDTAADITTLFHPSLVWVLVSQPGVQVGWTYTEDGLFVESTPTVSLVTSELVDIERDRRIDAGVLFEGVLYQTGAQDRENIMGKYMQALGVKITGAAWPADFQWIAADDSFVPMSLDTMMAFGSAVSDHKERHVFAGNALKRIEPIPVDYADDKWWP
ncbi:DUF4376 domain-containing protein [Pseudomonas sp. NPDC090201]|uniref:DUF4376 domain-containing protein n=1 Tax=Pseudomonas sp. NPDC090201 TaxID=3364475 RepID=UPI003828CF6C